MNANAKKKPRSRQLPGFIANRGRRNRPSQRRKNQNDKLETRKCPGAPPATAVPPAGAKLPAGERPAILLASLANVTTSTARAWLAGTHKPQARHGARLELLRRVLAETRLNRSAALGLQARAQPSSPIGGYPMTESPIDEPEANDAFDWGTLVLELLISEQPWAAELFELALDAYSTADPAAAEAAAREFCARAASLPPDADPEGDAP